MNQVSKELINAEAAAKMLGVKTRTVFDWAQARRIPCVRLGPRCIRFNPEALRRWIKEKEIPEEQ
jgi:excisionase family DNA binding protein